MECMVLLVSLIWGRLSLLTRTSVRNVDKGKESKKANSNRKERKIETLTRNKALVHDILEAENENSKSILKFF